MLHLKKFTSNEKSCLQFSRNLMTLENLDVSISDYLTEKDEALSPMNKLEENEEFFLPNELNEDVIIYSNRSERSIYDSSLNELLKS